MAGSEHMAEPWSEDEAPGFHGGCTVCVVMRAMLPSHEHTGDLVIIPHPGSASATGFTGEYETDRFFTVVMPILFVVAIAVIGLAGFLVAR